MPSPETEHASVAVDKGEYQLGGQQMSYRYMTNAVGWLLHDTLVHPLTGIVGFAGRLTWSMRLMALSHHLHNVTAPNNDTLADYAEALYRAGCNEGGGQLTEEQWRRREERRRWDNENLSPECLATRFVDFEDLRHDAGRHGLCSKAAVCKCRCHETSRFGTPRKIAGIEARLTAIEQQLAQILERLGSPAQAETRDEHHD